MISIVFIACRLRVSQTDGGLPLYASMLNLKVTELDVKCWGVDLLWWKGDPPWLPLDLVISGPLQEPLPRSQFFYEPPHCSQVLDYKDLQVVDVPCATKGLLYSEREAQLLEFILNHPNEKKDTNKRNTIDWRKFADRWKYYCQLEKCLGNFNFHIRDQYQLKQKQERKKENVIDFICICFHVYINYNCIWKFWCHIHDVISNFYFFNYM
jgi:hypothetical protein